MTRVRRAAFLLLLVLDVYPLRRLGLASDVAPMVAMLASPRSGWITGQVLSISGGFSMV